MLVRLTNDPRPYAWGEVGAISRLFGRDASGSPEAELWLGTHAGSPARIVDDGAPGRDLARWASETLPEGRLPFLLKVLAAGEPLSLQVHPSPKQARDGFERESAAGIPVDAPHRSYRDPFAKPELLMALSDPFVALAGFRPAQESAADLASLEDTRLRPLLDRLTDDDALKPTVAWLIAGGHEVSGVVAALGEAAGSQASAEAPPWLRSLALVSAHYPGDSGVAVATLLHTVVLRPGEALFLPAGNLHAYLSGLGIEIMGASDNVLRCGLTPKHIDADELLRVLDARSMPAPILAPSRPAPGVTLFSPPVEEFQLVSVDRGAAVDGLAIGSEGPTLVLCLEGSVQLPDGSTLARGEAVLSDDGPLVVRGDGRLVAARRGIANTV
ncbi:mannose-6-phosphate isomerase, class I [Microcella alkalica]|uniref:mannose-6-phosphate isomerase, class I n=1 Tax=Microcella alkalica TaxID=355930 RepID=UPI00145E2BA9|nr:mannose-6-phosphate isomerase, class I [Microcella alkalica]